MSITNLRIPIFLLMTALVLIAAGLLAQQDESEVDLQVTKTVDNDTPDSPGQTIEFAIEIKNLSETTAENIVVEDRLPPELAIPEVMVPATSAGTYDIETALWRIDEIAPGQAELLTLPAIVSATPQPACIRNRATLVSTDAISLNNASDAIIRRPDIERCVDLIPGWNRPAFGDDFCGGKQRVSYTLTVYNRGLEDARDVTLTVSETSSFRLPGFKLTSSNCSGLQCRWDAIPANHMRTVLAESSVFRNGQSREHSIRLVVQSADVDYEPENDIYTATRRITSFSNPCPGYGVPEPALPGGGGGGGGGCFIATAAYGTPFDDRIDILREFRDQWLMPYPFGQRLVRAYYRFSPPIASRMETRPGMRTAIRALLVPVIGFLTYPTACLLLITLCGLVVFGRKWESPRPM